MGRGLDPGLFFNRHFLGGGLTVEMLSASGKSLYRVLDTIDEKLVAIESPRLAGLIELANLSSIVGNLLAGGIVKASNDVFARPATGHKYQDLRATGLDPGTQNIEIKVALEGNSPKGHLAKPGLYLTCRYVLADPDGHFEIGQRGDVVWIWEMRFGHLLLEHFALSNTAGDSGKTAVVTSTGMKALNPIYFDADLCPYPLGGKRRRDLNELVRRDEAGVEQEIKRLD